MIRVWLSLTTTFVMVGLVLSPLNAQTREEGGNLMNEAIRLEQQAQTTQEREHAIEQYEKALSTFQRVGFSHGILQAVNSLGNLNFKVEKYDKALKYWEQAIRVSGDLRDLKAESMALNNLGTVYWKLNEYAKALEAYEKALARKKEVNDLQGLPVVLTNMGVVYSDRGDYDRAEKCYLEALTLCESRQDSSAQKSALLNLGVIYRKTGRYQKATRTYERALRIAQEMKDPRGQGSVLNNLGNVYIDLSQYAQAVSCFEAALRIAGQVHGLNDIRHNALNNLGTVYHAWSDYGKAAEYYQKSLAMKRALGDSRGEAESLNNLAVVYKDWGFYDKAVGTYVKALSISSQLHNPEGEAAVLQNMAIIHSLRGEYDKAVHCYGEALNIQRKLKNPSGEAHTMAGLGKIHAHLGQYDKALEQYEKALSIFRHIKHLKGEGQALVDSGTALMQCGRYREALPRFREALEIYGRIDLPLYWIRKNVADLCMDIGDPDNAAYFIQGVDHWASLGRLHLLKKEYEKAEYYYEKLRRRSEETRNADNLFTAYTGLGFCYEAMGADDKAQKWFRNAVNMTEELRSSLDKARRERFFDVKIEGFLRIAPYEGLVRVLHKMHKPREALKMSEYSKARVFSEGMIGVASPNNTRVPADVLRINEEILNQLAELKKRRQTAHERSDSEAIMLLERQIDSLGQKLESQVRMLRNKYPLFAATRYPQPMDLDQTALRPHEWSLIYEVTDSGMFVWLLHGKHLLKSSFKPISREELEAIIRRFRKPLEVGPEESVEAKLRMFDFDAGKKLSDLLLSEVLHALPQGASLIVVPDDCLGVLPFEMLVLGGDGIVTEDSQIAQVSGAEFFGDRNPLSYYQSLTALTLARTYRERVSTGKKTLVVADPVFDDSDLRFSGLPQERRSQKDGIIVEKLMSIKLLNGLTFPRLSLTAELGHYLERIHPDRTDVYSGMRASKTTLYGKSLTDYASMVFATHGYLGADLPGVLEPVLVLTLPGQPKDCDGFLRMSEVMNLKMAADIVALTACQTGLGKHTSGEGTMSMGRAFQYAGARSVLMSLWTVAESSSVKLVEGFFCNLKDGKNRLEALQAARKEIREAGYDHPFFWAPFILVGESN